MIANRDDKYTIAIDAIDNAWWAVRALVSVSLPPDTAVRDRDLKLTHHMRALSDIQYDVTELRLAEIQQKEREVLNDR